MEQPMQRGARTEWRTRRQAVRFPNRKLIAET